MFGSSSTTNNFAMREDPVHTDLTSRPFVAGTTGLGRQGRRMLNSAPPYGKLRATISPPCATTIRLQIDRPSPVPVSFDVTKGSKARAKTASDSPDPESEIRISHQATFRAA